MHVPPLKPHPTQTDTTVAGGPAAPGRGRSRSPLFVLGVWLLTLHWLLPAPCVAADDRAALTELPAHLGAVVYQVDGDSPRQLYIVATGHRSAVTGAQRAATLQAQVETFRIGEWLIRCRRVGLLLPEGYFGRTPPAVPSPEAAALDDGATLAERLADPSCLVNAELLLHERYGVALRQVEDPELYRATLALLRTAQESADRLDPEFDARLAFLQKCRSAALLQGAPQAISIPPDASGALLTIGLSHLDDILEFLDTGTIALPARDGLPTQLGERLPPTPGSQPFGVTVIIPRSLLDNARVAHLDRG